MNKKLRQRSCLYMGPKFNDIAKENIGNKIIQFIKDKDKNFNIYSNQNLLSQSKYP